MDRFAKIKRRKIEEEEIFLFNTNTCLQKLIGILIGYYIKKEKKLDLKSLRNMAPPLIKNIEKENEKSVKLREHYEVMLLKIFDSIPDYKILEVFKEIMREMQKMSQET